MKLIENFTRKRVVIVKAFSLPLAHTHIRPEYQHFPHNRLRRGDAKPRWRGHHIHQPSPQWGARLVAIERRKISASAARNVCLLCVCVRVCVLALGKCEKGMKMVSSTDSHTVRGATVRRSTFEIGRPVASFLGCRKSDSKSDIELASRSL